MTISEVVEALQNDQAIVVGDTTFQPRGFDAVRLETNETIYWAVAKSGNWLSIDPEADEIIMFEDIDEELEPEDDTVVYGGQDYEFSYEGSATMKSEDGEDITLTFQEFESSTGYLIRLTDNENAGEKKVSVGSKLTEDELQMA
ncbi:TPA: hypothetical protein DEP96_03525 [Candidatus Uhrbacteria bacterium]|nr:hypothetical protein [Candidatus Uhrbacteria bacterium]